MTWNIANAKQQFSEVVRLSAQEPQAIYSHKRAVAVIVNPETFAEFQNWRMQKSKQNIASSLASLRTELVANGIEDGLQSTPRKDREIAFTTMIAE